MSNANRIDPLAAAVAIILAGASVSPASAQTRLDVYSDDFSGGSMPLPSSAVRDTRIDMHIERLHVIQRGIGALRAELNGHSHPPHRHPPHVHVTRTGVSGTVSGDSGDSDTVSVYSETDRPGALETMSVQRSSLDSQGRVSIGQHSYTSNFSKSNRGQGGDGGGDGY